MAAAGLRPCNYCQQQKPYNDESHFWKDHWYCSKKCGHDAGDRSACGRNCGCTGYAKKRRLLRAHRVNMRVMDELMREQGLEEELEERMEDETGNTNFWLGHCESMDEDSEQEDPEAALRLELADTEAALRLELADRSAFVEAATGALQYIKVSEDLERARMMLEDVRSQQSR